MAMCGCATNPVTGEEELRIISTQQEVEMGGRIDVQVRSQYRAVTGTPEAVRVETIGAKMAAVCDRRDIQYHFALLDSAELNAFAAPGGYIYVTTTLLRAVGDDSELAAVIGHEVGHVAAFHSVHQMQRALGWDIMKALILEDRASQRATNAADIAFNKVVMTGFSRKDEDQADDLGVKYSAKGGYDPYGMGRFFVKLGQLQRENRANKAFEFLMSHPNTESRRQRAEAEAAKYARTRK